MTNMKKISKIIIVVIAVVLNFIIIRYVNLGKVEDKTPALGFELKADKDDTYTLYFSDDDIFDEEHKAGYTYSKKGKFVEAALGVDMTKQHIRFDVGTQDADIYIKNLNMQMLFSKIALSDDVILNGTDTNDIKLIEGTTEGIHIVTNGEDPYVMLDLDIQGVYDDLQHKLNQLSWVFDIVLCIILDMCILFFVMHFDDYMEIPIDIIRNKRLALKLSKNDFKTKFAGSYLGIVWAFIQPIVTVLVYWFVFEVGLRAGRMCDYPFVLWFMTGLIPWFYFSEALNGGTNSLIEYNYLVKKVVFKISILPLVKVISAVFVHLFFVVFVIILAACYGYTPDVYSLQILYYILCSFILVLGMAYFTSAVVVFFRDLSQLINIILQVGMWATPIMWNAESMIPAKWLLIFKLNPVYYIVDGFRDAILGKVWLWDKSMWTAYFWIIVIVFFMFGTKVFRRLKVHFADVL